MSSTRGFDKWTSVFAANEQATRHAEERVKASEPRRSSWLGPTRPSVAHDIVRSRWFVAATTDRV